jgi:hypothetical protein
MVSEDGAIMVLRNVGNLSQRCTVSQPRRPGLDGLSLQQSHRQTERQNGQTDGRTDTINTTLHNPLLTGGNVSFTGSPIMQLKPHTLPSY